MYRRVEAVAVARSWIRTPYVLGGRRRSAGVDCCTLLAEYLTEINPEFRSQLETLGYYSADWFHHESEDRYLVGLRKFGTLVSETIARGGVKADPGDLVLFKIRQRRVYNHGAIVTRWPYGVHAQADGVREVDLVSCPLTAFRQMAVFDPWGKRDE